MSASNAAREAIWLRQLLAELGFAQAGATEILSDNQGSIALTKNPVHHQRTKHIDVQHHFIRQLHETGVIVLRYVSTDDMVADVLTKALARNKHLACAEGLGVHGQTA
jgi:hypothetical protein